MADVLIVEDDEKTRQAFRVVVSRLGHDVRVAENFDTACEEINSQVPDLVITDWDLGGAEGCTGVEVVKLVMEFDANAAVIMVTGNSIETLSDNTLSLPIKAYLKKPIDLSSLKSILNDVFL